VIGKICDQACNDGSDCGDGGDGLCQDGSVCLANTCADGSMCDGGLCADESACQPTRFGARCVADGSGDHCDRAKDNTPAGGKNCYPAPIPFVIDIVPDPECESDCLYPVTNGGCWNEDQIGLILGAWDFFPSVPTPTPAPTATPGFIGSIIDSGATDFRLDAGVDIVNLTTGVQMHWDCTTVGPIPICAGVVDLDLGLNQIVVTTYDLAGKRGTTRITINRVDGSCS
jgi:hypothetical protein